MSKTVIKSISTTKATFSGNVSSVSTTTTEVADSSDISALEERVNKSIEEKVHKLEHRVKELETLISSFAEENKAFKNLLSNSFKEHVEIEKQELYSVYEDIANKITNPQNY